MEHPPKGTCGVNDELGAAYLRHRWDSRIRDAVFLDAEPSEHPTTVFLGGQPAAGKTDAYGFITDTIANIIPINGDDYRRFHPLYDLLLQYNPLDMPAATASASAAWIAMAVEHANARGYSTIIEGTWRDDNVVLSESGNAKRLNRCTWAVIVATKPAISRIGTLTRYLDKLAVGQTARWTPLQAHDNTVEALRGNVPIIAGSESVDRFTVIDRQGRVLADGREQADKLEASSVWRNDFDASLTVEELRFAENRLKHIDNLIHTLAITDEQVLHAVEAARKALV